MGKKSKNSKNVHLPGIQESGTSHLEIGRFYFLNQRYDEAIRKFNQSIKDEPDKSEAYYNLGLVYETKGQFSRAKEAFTKALELAPGHKPSEEHLAKLVGG